LAEHGIEPQGRRTYRNVEYVPGGHERQKLHIYLPEQAGVDVKFHTVKGGGHVFRDAQADRMVKELFDKHLKK